jgi:hypothetical protein
MTVADLPKSFAWRSVDFVPAKDVREIEVFLMYDVYLTPGAIESNTRLVVANNDSNKRQTARNNEVSRSVENPRTDWTHCGSTSF